jgi:hypothetical protein
MGKAFARNAQLPEQIIHSIGASMLPMVDKLTDSELSKEQQTVVIFSYYVSRITDLIIFQRSTDLTSVDEISVDEIGLEEISFAETMCNSFFYAQTQIEYYGLGKINNTLRKTRFKQEVGALIEKLRLAE